MLGDLAALTGGGPVRAVTLELDTPSTVAPGVAAEDRHWKVVNASPRESETERLRPEEFATRFGLPLAASTGSTPDGTTARPGAPQEARIDIALRNDEVWHWLALALVGLLLAEGFLANRTTA
jgi:hypothetical protein